MLSQQKNNAFYFQNLDGLRFVCFLMVFLFHSFHTEMDVIKTNDTYVFIKNSLFKNGNLGVNVFFVLSGFLITYLLLIEKINTDKINLAKFWMRRILRIWPLYFLCVVIGFVVFPYLKHSSGVSFDENANLLNYLTFTSNFDLLYNGLPDASILGVLWSISIEEQFYLFWPILFAVTPVRKSWIPIVIVAIISLVFRFNANTNNEMEYHSLSCMGDLSIGAIGAWLILFNERFKLFIQNSSTWLIVLIYGLFVGFYLFKDELSALSMTFFHLNKFIFSFLSIFIILEQCFAVNSFFKFSSFSFISKLGKYTYGMYCLQFLGILIVLKTFQFLGVEENLTRILVIDPIGSLTLTILLATGSYHLFEKHFLKWKNKFSVIG